MIIQRTRVCMYGVFAVVHVYMYMGCLQIALENKSIFVVTNP